MCGVYLRICKETCKEIDSAHFDNDNLNFISHRGPDEKKLMYLGKDIALGFARLSIRSIDSGSQPWKYKSFYSVINGELYNESDIVKIVRNNPKSPKIMPQGDMQILALYLQLMGMTEIRKVEGMFAGYILNLLENKVYLIRDRFGEKPLFFCMDEKHLFISSEARFSGIENKIEIEPKDLKNGFFDFKNDSSIKEVMPGEIVTISLNDFSINKWKYWSWNSKFITSNDDLNLASVLEKSVLGSLASDVKVSTLLSGGVDSVAVSLIASRLSNYILPSYTLKMPDESFDESRKAELIAKKIGLDHKVIEIDLEEVGNSIYKIIDAMDVPIFDTACISMFMLCSKVREKVALSGDGGDEIFRGYSLYKNIEFLKIVDKYVPKFIVSQVLRLALLKLNTHQYGGLGFKVSRSMTILKSELPLEVGALSPLAGTALFDEINYRYNPDRILNLKRLSKFSSLDYHYRNNILPKVYLRKIDRMSMANGVEVRSPLLNSSLVSYTNLLYKDSPNIYGKKELINYISKYLPKDIFVGKKHGFSFPISRILKYVDKPDWNLPFLQNDLELVNKTWKDALDGNINSGIAIWSLLVTNSFNNRIVS